MKQQTTKQVTTKIAAISSARDTTAGAKLTSRASGIVQHKTASRGRPRIHASQTSTSTARVKANDDALILSGGRILSRLRLRKEAVVALALLTASCDSERAAIETALTSTPLDATAFVALRKDDVDQVTVTGERRIKNGKPRTTTDRVKAADDLLIRSGGRILNRLRLSAEAVAVLERLKPAAGTDRRVVEHVLMYATRNSAFS